MENINCKDRIGILLSLVLVGILGCNTLSTPVVPASAPVVTLTEMPPISAGLSLTSNTISETSVSPLYTLAALVPFLTGSDDPRVQQFNQEAAALVQLEVDNFKQSMTEAPNPPVGNGSSFDLKYSLISPWGDILSLKFDIYTYFDGAAHPGQSSKTLTYNLAMGQHVDLAQLFLPGTDYLQVLADYCKTDLAGRDIMFDAFQTGADPLPDNYRNWNFSSDGVVITFDTYQVAPGAAGPQIVTIPYANLQAIIDPNGPLANFIN
jgi:hypothetical protein